MDLEFLKYERNLNYVANLAINLIALLFWQGLFVFRV